MASPDASISRSQTLGIKSEQNLMSGTEAVPCQSWIDKRRHVQSALDDSVPASHALPCFELSLFSDDADGPANNRRVARPATEGTSYSRPGRRPRDFGAQDPGHICSCVRRAA